jgi:hypothetical protein
MFNSTASQKILWEEKKMENHGGDGRRRVL